MSEVREETVGENTQDSVYPDYKSYIMSSRGYTLGLGRLAKARLFSVVQSPVNNYSTDSSGRILGLPDGGLGTGTIDTTLYKWFQFNPSVLSMDVYAQPTDPDPSINPGGTVGGGASLGLASSSVEMLFSREPETHAGADPGSRWSEYGRLGVAKDILDVFAVVKGDKAMLEAGADGRSISRLTSELMDLVRTGSEFLLSSKVAIQFSEDFVIYGYVTNMNFRFVKFNHMLVPTMGYVGLYLDVHNAGNTSLINNNMTATARATSAAETAWGSLPDLGWGGTSSTSAGWDAATDLGWGN